VENIRASGEESEQMRRQASILGIQELWKKLHDIRFKAMGWFEALFKTKLSTPALF
jgi:hypothetical protein